MSDLPVDVLKKDVVSALRKKYPFIKIVHLAKYVTSNGIHYRNGMLLANGSTGGLPGFSEILHMCMVQTTCILF